VESAIDQFAKSYDLQTVSIPAEDMRAEAEKAYQKAEDLFTNYQARPENLRNAVIRYQLAIEFYEQFDPPPKELAVAKRHLKDAESILKKSFPTRRPTSIFCTAGNNIWRPPKSAGN
jgi:hypothetical protein